MEKIAFIFDFVFDGMTAIGTFLTGIVAVIGIKVEGWRLK